jgi:hypothetical protein
MILNMKLHAPIAAALAWLLMSAGCTTYPEGPEFSPFSARYRATNIWKWAYEEVGGENLTGERSGSTIEFSESGEVRICPPSDSCTAGTWNLISKNTKLQMIFDGVAVAYTIDLLSRQEMWIRYEDPDSGVLTRWELVPATP